MNGRRSEDGQGQGVSTPLTLANGIMGGEKTRNLPKAFATMTSVLRESTLTKEYCSLVEVLEDEKLSGLYVIPSAKFCDLWFGVLFVRGGSSPYQGGVFRFTITFPPDFPTTQTIPILTFQPPVFHPSIHPSRGSFDLRRYFKQGWNQSTHRVWHILKLMRTSFYKVEPSSLVNKAAHDLLENNPVEFNARVQKDVESSEKKIYDEAPSEYKNDTNWMRCSPYDGRIHDTLRPAKLPQGKFNLSLTSNNGEDVVKAKSSGRQRGLSWMM